VNVCGRVRFESEWIGLDVEVLLVEIGACCDEKGKARENGVIWRIFLCDGKSVLKMWLCI
jgi:hypothetical protein